jgi:spermidine synthase
VKREFVGATVRNNLCVCDFFGFLVALRDLSMKKNQRDVECDEASVTMSELDGVRYLHLGTPWVQGAMRIARPNQIELEYVRRMMACLLLRPSADLSLGHAVQLGLGAGAITRFCHSVLKMQTTVLEINPSVVAAGHMWFRLPVSNSRLQVLQQDAAAFVQNPDHAATVDVLCIDLYDHLAAGPVLDSAEFYADCARTLVPGGVLAVNLFGRSANWLQSANRIAQAMGFERVRSLQATREGNTAVIACAQANWPDRETLLQRAVYIEDKFKLPAKKWLRMIRVLPESN